MFQAKIKPLPAWLGGTLSRLEIVRSSAMDTYKPKVGEVLRCWFCNRTTFAVFDHVLLCYGKGSCSTHYVLLPWVAVETQVSILEDTLQGMRLRCGEKIEGYSCPGNAWNFKPEAARCARCKTQWFAGEESRMTEMVALLDDATRDEHRRNGRLNVNGGPTWPGVKIPEPWRPRTDLTQKQLTKKMAYYRYREVQKLETGRDPAVDYRKARNTW